METATETAPEPIAKTPTPEIVRETIQAQHKFSVDETLKLKDDLLAAIRNETQIEAEFASVKAEFKSRNEKAVLEKDSILRRMTDGFEMRPTRAIIQFHVPEHGRKTYFREDGGEVIRDEPMTFSDQERPLFKDKDGKDATEPERGEETIGTGEPSEFLSTEGEGTKDDLGGILDVPGAGQTNVGDALNVAAVKTDQPQFQIKDFGLDDWTPGNLIKAFRTGAKKVGWSEPAISAMRGQLFAIDNIPAMKDLLRPFVISDAPEFEALMADAKRDFNDGTLMRAIFGQILAHYPSKYPGGNSEQNFLQFEADVEEARIQDGRTTED